MINKFTVEIEMQERWVPHFLSMLKKMERNGNIGTSSKVSMFSDGDGDFCPKFKTDIEFKEVVPAVENEHEAMYDAG